MTVKPETAARILGLSAARSITDPDRAELAAQHLAELNIPKAEREALADLVRSLAVDPELRAAVIEFWDYRKFKGRKKK